MKPKYKSLKDLWKQRYQKRYGGVAGRKLKAKEMREWRLKQKTKCTK